MTDIRLHIERLSVDDSILAGASPGALAAALEEHLTALLARRGLRISVPSASPRAPAGTSILEVPATRDPDHFGARLAAAVHGAVSAAGRAGPAGHTGEGA